MSISPDTLPSSLRKPVESSRFAQNLSTRAHQPTIIAAGPARAALLLKSRFGRLPQESEDAKITGSTRSLQRRLLALNIGGSLLKTTSLLNTTALLKTRIA